MLTTTHLLETDRPSSLTAVRTLLNKATTGEIGYYPSPTNWRNEVLYFLLPDRFSDGNEASRALLTRAEIRSLRQSSSRPDWNWEQWANSGMEWQGGTLAGISDQLPYLNKLGITTLWIGPVFKQRARLNTYHGYGIQDFLDIDPRFGSREDLINLVKNAHSKDMKIILDIIVNHSGDNWGYVAPNQALDSAMNEPPYLDWPDFYGAPFDPITKDWQLAWRNEFQKGFTSQSAGLTGSHDGVWPVEFQSITHYTRAGMGDLGKTGDVRDPHDQHKRTDFFSLKDFALDTPETLTSLIDCYKYWIALTDCDGFRIDTVKHMALEDTRNFCGAIREFTDLIGKRNFFMVGEIAGGDDFQDIVLDYTQMMVRNLNAALDIGRVRPLLQAIAKGLSPAKDYFDMFDEQSKGFESHRSFGDRHVSILDDHDHVFGDKLRFSALIPDHSPVKDYQVVVGTAIQLFTLGIPCIYYGTEQALAGPAQSQIHFLLNQGWNDGSKAGDRYLREAMFGPEHPRASSNLDLQTQITTPNTTLPGFGPFGTEGKHCFDSQSPAYIRIADLCATRAKNTVLRSGRQYLRQCRTPGTDFVFPKAGEVVAWSRIMDNIEAICIINPNAETGRGGDIVVSSELSQVGSRYKVVSNTSQTCSGNEAFNGTHPVGSTVSVKGLSRPGEPAFIEIRDIQPAEVLILIKEQ